MPEPSDFDLCQTCGAWRSAHKAGLQDPLTAHDFAEPLMPDFDQIAKDLALSALGAGLPRFPQATAQHQVNIAEQLRQVWNARGAADLEAIDEVAHTNDVPVANAIRKLDR